MNSNLESNFWKYTIFLITNKRVWVTIMAIYYLTIPGVNEIGISYVLLAGSITSVIFEIPSGYWADTIGHKNALIFSRILAIISSVFYLISFDLITLIIASIFLSLSIAFTSGTGSAFLRETIYALNRKDEYAKIVGRIKSLGFAIPLLLSAVVPFFVKIDIKIPFLVGLIIDIIGLISAFSLVSPTQTKIAIKELGLKNLISIIKESYKIGFIKYSIYTGILSGLIFAIGNYRGPYQASFGVDIAIFGVLFTIGRLLASVLLWFSGFIQKIFSLKKFFLFQSLSYAIIFIILGTTSNVYIAVSVFALQNGLKWGLTEIEDSYFVDLLAESKHKATILSIGAQVQQIIAGIAGLYVGWIIFTYGYSQGFLLFAITFIAIMIPAYLITFIFTKQSHNGK